MTRESRSANGALGTGWSLALQSALVGTRPSGRSLIHPVVANSGSPLNLPVDCARQIAKELAVVLGVSQASHLPGAEPLL